MHESIEELRMIEYNPGSIGAIEDPTQDEQLLAVNNDPSSIQYFLIKASRDVRLRAIELDPTVIKFYSDSSREEQFLAIQLNADVIDLIQNKSFKTKLIYLYIYYKAILLPVIVSSLLLSNLSCYKEHDKVSVVDSVTVKPLTKPVIDSAEAYKIVKDYYSKEPKYVVVALIGNSPVIVSISEVGIGKPRLSVLEKFANVWQESRKIVIEDYGFIKLDSLELVNINHKEYLYFEFLQPGGSMGDANYYYSLYDYMNNKIFQLRYFGFFKGDKINGSFVNLDSLRTVDGIRKFFEQKVLSSSIIYRGPRDSVTRRSLEID